jgi:hypothetical protein
VRRGALPVSAAVRGHARWRALALMLAAVAGPTLGAHRAVAAPCGRPDVDVTFPPSGALAVPSNAILSAHYRAPAELADETVALTGPDGAPIAADISYDAAESMLRALPRTPLVPGEHRVVWPGLRGVATSRGLGQTTSFTVSADADAAAPRFDGLLGAKWDLSREEDPCTSGLEDRFSYDLELGSVSDDQKASLLSVVVFETQSPTHDASAPPKELAVLPIGRDGHVQVARASTRAGTVCFAAVVRDLTLAASGGGDRQACVKTTAPPFFAGCALARGHERPGRASALWGAALLVLASLGRRQRARAAAVGLGALAALGCDGGASAPRAAPEPHLSQASAFVPAGDGWSQRHVRLPDDGEWRCAELDGVVLCAGGEPAAGVVSAGAASGYRCGERRGSPRRERVCVDPTPDYPPGEPSRYRCRFSSVHGLTRECQPRQSGAAVVVARLPARAPDCWLDADCTGRCEHGFCSAGQP